MSVKNKEKRQRTEKERKAAKAAKAKPKVRAPKEIAALRKVSRAELDAIIQGVAAQFADRDEKIKESISGLWTNQTELKGGLDVAEFHLRAYRRLIADLCNEVYHEGAVEMIELPDSPSKFRMDAEGKPLPARVVNMRHYFMLAQQEIKEIHEAEQRKREAEQEAAKEIERMAEEAAKAKEEPAGETPPAQDDGVPDGAAIFGGDVHAEGDPGNEGHEEGEVPAAGGGGEDGAPGSLPEVEVPAVQAGDGGSQAEQ